MACGHKNPKQPGSVLQPRFRHRLIHTSQLCVYSQPQKESEQHHPQSHPQSQAQPEKEKANDTNSLQEMPLALKYKKYPPPALIIR